MDQLTEEHNIPVTHFGLEWIGSANATRWSTVRKINLLGMKGPYNYFNIFLPKKALEAKRDKEGMHAHCMRAYKMMIYCAMISL